MMMCILRDGFGGNGSIGDINVNQRMANVCHSAFGSVKFGDDAIKLACDFDLLMMIHVSKKKKKKKKKNTTPNASFHLQLLYHFELHTIDRIV
jgi:hypothetical protein